MIRRRDFLKTGAAAAAVGVVGLPGSARAGANDQIRVAVVGVNGRGKSHISDLSGMKDVTIAAICDVDSKVGEGACDAIGKKAKRPAYVQDIRKLLEDKTIDAITIATPNHWHSLATLWALQAGKDVYVEKPLSHNVFEGRQITLAARKYNRIVQHGTQSRSSNGVRNAVEFMRAGKLGKVTEAVGLCYKPRNSIGKHAEGAKPPATVDYNLWLGPAPEKALHRSKFHYDWHWQWDYGNGDIGNQGVHQMDIARWGLGRGLPAGVISLGGRFGYEDDGETPNTQITVFDYGDAKLIFEVRGLKTNGLIDDVKIGNIFYGTEGVITIGGKGGIQCLMGKSREPHKIDTVAKGGPGGGHFGNFIAAVKSRKVADLNADVEEGHLSSALGHLANLSYRLGKPAAYQPGSQSFAIDQDKVATEMSEGMLAHLAANSVKLEALQYRLGRALKFDAKAEKFIGDAEADKLLTREYRAPFIVTEKV